MKETLLKYLESNFPDLTSELYVRFDLGSPHENGTDERIDQVTTRVTSLFEEVFKPDDFIYLYIKDYGGTEDSMFGNNTPTYLTDLLSTQRIEEDILYDIDEDVDELTGNTIELKNEFNVKIVYAKLASINYREILKGIGNYEQGRDPSIGESVYFMNTEKDIVFHMYDDRGCDVFGLNKDTLAPLYHKFRKWILDYNRIEIDYAFEEGLYTYVETTDEKEKRIKADQLQVKETNIDLFQDNTCHITHTLVIPNDKTDECINELSETGFTLFVDTKNCACSHLKVTKTDALAVIDYQTELMSLYSKKYEGAYLGWSVRKAF
ncbi:MULTISPECIES: DUF3885 domain-containing protein [Planococcus]|uniref:DUF3885 domain-containing protein n=1 Tax=Planococcus faecalis TaxID=1598147 RepID=A0ABN4XTX3_9BACL|nr:MULTISPECIES: DUF3885 domain-containing protein [Planococcus]AQU80739.1 hypothetical protein AJGP001_16225 [Planococcus faecalis]MDJ0331955.1 DUF3885 domain-containing protein [Planococcus sp. S3-L1]OHX55730.1 hypothetical protein BB777_00800 [Planococcus faecalis]